MSCRVASICPFPVCVWRRKFSIYERKFLERWNIHAGIWLTVTYWMGGKLLLMERNWRTMDKMHDMPRWGRGRERFKYFFSVEIWQDTLTHGDPIRGRVDSKPIGHEGGQNGHQCGTIDGEQFACKFAFKEKVHFDRRKGLISWTGGYNEKDETWVSTCM